MTNKVQKNYTQINNKLKTNFEDVKYLIALHLQVLEEIKAINQRIDRIQSNIDSIYGD